MKKNEYQYLMADEYFLEYDNEYTSFQVEDTQFFVKLNDQSAPIYQSKIIYNPYASLVGNYCIKDSSIILIQKVDPIFVCLKVISKHFINQNEKLVQIESLFNRENNFEFYLSNHKELQKNIDLICEIKLLGEEIYVKPNKEKLFEFLELKFQQIQNYINFESNNAFKCSSINRKHQDSAEGEACVLFKEYLDYSLWSEFSQSKQKNTLSQSQEEMPTQQDSFNIKNQINNTSNKKENKISASQMKNEKAAKGCMRMEQFCQQKKK